MNATIQILRLVVVMALVIAAAALATPKGRVPLALRGILRMLRRDHGLVEKAASEGVVPIWKRSLAFLCILVALCLALV